VFRVREGPDWVCFGDAQSLPSVWRSSDPYGRAVVSVFHVVRPEDGWPAVNRRWPTVSRYPITMKASRRRLLLFGSMIEMTRHRHKTAYFGGLRHRAPLREQRSDSPQVPAHLVFHRLMSPFRPRSIHSPAHQAIPSLGIAPPSCICAPIHRHSRPSRFIRNAFTTSSFSSQSMSTPRNPCDVIPHTNVYYQVIYALYA
jgi:hypothetical protein